MMRFFTPWALYALLLGTVVSAKVPQALENQKNSGSDSARDFDRAESLMKAGDESGALVSFSDYLRRYPQSPLAPDAQYDIGDLYYRRRQFAQAVEELKKVKGYGIEAHKVAEASVRMGECLKELNRSEDAKIEWEAVIRRFPNSTAAAKANVLREGMK